MQLLVETAYGYGLFKLKKGSLDDHKLSELVTANSTNLRDDIKLKKFRLFKTSNEAMRDLESLQDGKIGHILNDFLKGISQKLIVVDKALGKRIHDELGISVFYKKNAEELSKLVKQNIKYLCDELGVVDTGKMALSLSHGMARLKLKFKQRNIDCMVVQAISLIDDLDKDMNVLSMRVREWFGLYFPELTSLVSDSSSYLKIVRLIKDPKILKTGDLEDELDEQLAKSIVSIAQITMGMEMPEEERNQILQLSERIQELEEYRAQLQTYLSNRMAAVAPNLTAVVGDIIGARLIARAGTLLGLAKHPASTIQLLGAEKALFKALKSRSATPKYGLIYHASLVGRANPKIKGKIARMLAAKLSLCARIDALSDTPPDGIGLQCFQQLSAKIDSSREANHPFLLNSNRDRDGNTLVNPIEIKRRSLSVSNDVPQQPAPKKRKMRREDPK